MTSKGRSANSSRLRIGRRSVDHGIYCVTKVVENRRALLANANASNVLLNSWRHLRVAARVKVFAYCIMPDHIHLIFALMPCEELSKVVGDTCKFTARELNQPSRSKGRFWQQGFHDRRCRTDAEVLEISEYVEHNPVRAGLVDTADAWPYSSASDTSQQELDREWFSLG